MRGRVAAQGVPAPRAPRDAATGFVGNDGAVSAADYTTATAPGITQNHYSCLMVWLCCRERAGARP
jgi:hypothetical protein